MTMLCTDIIWKFLLWSGFSGRLSGRSGGEVAVVVHSLYLLRHICSLLRYVGMREMQSKEYQARPSYTGNLVIPQEAQL